MTDLPDAVVEGEKGGGVMPSSVLRRLLIIGAAIIAKRKT